MLWGCYSWFTCVLGLIVQFELVDTAVAGKAGAGQSAQLLVCETSKELHSYSELFVDDVDSAEQHGEGEVVEEGVHPTYRSWQWEVFPESQMAAELDFLEGFIH